jgi:hypothetical protein
MDAVVRWIADCKLLFVQTEFQAVIGLMNGTVQIRG